MSMYTAPRRATRKRSLSRRARIVLLASLLVPASLLAVANLPASAAAKYATIQDVQDAISAALAPIQSAIANLQQQQTTQANQISNLQNAPSKSLKAYDANDQELGLAVDHTGNQTTIYSPTLQRSIYLSINNITSINNDLASNVSVYFQSPDCTGTAYALADRDTPYNISYTLPNGTTTYITPNDLIAVGPQHFYVIPDSETATFMQPNSMQYWTGGNSVGCFTGPFNFQPEPHAYALQQVNLPFTLPLALPLQFKYQ
jgi:hypothetical protein